MILYEVNLRVKVSRAEEFTLWLKQHIQQMLQVEGFVSAELLEQEEEEEEAPPTQRQLVVHYRLKSLDHLHSYLQNQAPQMRQEGLDLFGSDFSATRRVLLPKDLP